jgi:dihydroorotate dehydrogenase
LKPFLISPPFGNWIRSPECTSVLGSFTWEARPGLIYHAIRSLRHVKGGWINQIGLRNRGIRAIRRFEPRFIYSLVGLNDGDWERMLEHCPPGLTIEVNLGCPNIHEYGIPPSVLKDYCTKFNVIAKLSPSGNVDEMAAMCVEAGALLHCSNTVPSPFGGISGLPLLIVNLPIVARLAARYPGKIIAGGGIYGREIVRAYAQAGATGFSLATVWFTPWRVSAILEEIR